MWVNSPTDYSEQNLFFLFISLLNCLVTIFLLVFNTIGLFCLLVERLAAHFAVQFVFLSPLFTSSVIKVNHLFPFFLYCISSLVTHIKPLLAMLYLIMVLIIVNKAKFAFI